MHKEEQTGLQKLEAEDTASDKHVEQLSAETAAVQAEDTRNDVEQAAYETEDPADEDDTKRVLDLATNLKQSDLLPQGWVEKTDEKTGKTYYENVAARKTTWDPPRSLVSIALAAARGQRDSQAEISSLKMKLEEMTSKDLGEGASVGSSCEAPVNAMKAQMQNAAMERIEKLMSGLATDLNLTGEQQKLLSGLLKKQKQAPFVAAAPSTPEKKAAESKHKDAPKAPEKEHKDLGESASIEEDQNAADELAMAKAESAGMKAAQQSAMKEAARLEARDSNLRKQVQDTAKAEDEKLAKEDDELEQASKAEDRLASDIMGPKATKAERREEKVLLGESPTNLDDEDHDALEFDIPIDKN